MGSSSGLLGYIEVLETTGEVLMTSTATDVTLTLVIPDAQHHPNGPIPHSYRHARDVPPPPVP